MHKKTISKILSLVLALMLLVRGNVFAEESTCNGTDTRNLKPSATKEEYIQQVLNADYLTKEQKDLMINKINGTIRLPSAYAASYGENVELSVDTCQQPNDYFCGPATTQQTLNFFGKYIDQYTIAKAEGTTESNGTDSGRVLGYLQSQSLWNYYITKPITSLPVLLSEMDTSLRGVKAPPIALIKSANRVDWKYPTSGHYINISGQQSAATQATVQFKIVDSFAHKTNVKTSPYWVQASMLYKAITNHAYKQIMQ